MAHISEAAPLQIERFYTGWYSYRNPLIVPIRQMGRRIIELYDALNDGLNMECTNRLTLARRPGYTVISDVAIDGQALSFYTFKPSDFPGQCYPVVDTTSVVAYFQPSLANPFVALVPKETKGRTNFAQVGAYCYMAQELFSNKWDSPGGAQGVTKWGIEMYDNAHNKGPNIALTIANLPSNQTNPNPWSIAGYSTVTLPPGTISSWLSCTGFGIGGETITLAFEVSGFVVGLRGASVTGASDGVGLNVRMLRNGALYGVKRTVTLPTNSGTTTTPIDQLGSPADTWDGAWQLGDILSADFGVAVQAVNTSASPATFTIPVVTMSVFYNKGAGVALPPPPPGPGVGPGAGLAPELGFRYKYCYGNANSGHISSPTLASFLESGPGATPDGLIKPVNQPVIVYLQPSPDPQVTDIHVFRTTDGGGEPFFECLASPVPNNSPVDGLGRIEFFDGGADNQLQIFNICPDPHFNDPPPGGAIDPVWYGGRLWLHRQHQLFFASGPDIQMGNEQESWFPEYVFAIPHGQIIRKFATPNGLLLVTNDDILIVRGINTPSFTVNDFARDIGMRTWTAGDTDGTNVYLYTSDRQFLLLAPNGFTSVSANIADRIEAVDPTKAYVAMYRYTAQQNFVFLGDGSSFLYPFNQELQAWCLPQQPVQGVEAIGTVETSPGVYQFWRSHSFASPPAPSGVISQISFRDVSSFLDEGVAYPCNVIFGPIPLADQLTLAQIRDIALLRSRTSSTRTVSCMANEIFPIAGRQFEIMQSSSWEPPELDESLSYIGERFTWKSTPLSELVNVIFFRVDFSADPNLDELFIYTLGGTQTTGGSSLGQPGQLPQLQGR